jgi:hypothetical protein
VSVEKIALRLVGFGPMLMHSSRLADPFDPLAKELSKITKKSAKTDPDHHRIAELEWHGSLWLHEGQPCLPPAAIKGAFVTGAKSVKELWQDPRFRHREMVRR